MGSILAWNGRTFRFLPEPKKKDELEEKRKNLKSRGSVVVNHNVVSLSGGVSMGGVRFVPMTCFSGP